jgi:hypothetical protein
MRPGGSGGVPVGPPGRPPRPRTLCVRSKEAGRLTLPLSVRACCARPWTAAWATCLLRETLFARCQGRRPRPAGGPSAGSCSARRCRRWLEVKPRLRPIASRRPRGSTSPMTGSCGSSRRRGRPQFHFLERGTPWTWRGRFCGWPAGACSAAGFGRIRSLPRWATSCTTSAHARGARGLSFLLAGARLHRRLCGLAGSAAASSWRALSEPSPVTARRPPPSATRRPLRLRVRRGRWVGAGGARGAVRPPSTFL